MGLACTLTGHKCTRVTTAVQEWEQNDKARNTTTTVTIESSYWRCTKCGKKS